MCVVKSVSRLMIRSASKSAKIAALKNKLKDLEEESKTLLKYPDVNSEVKDEQ